MNEIKIEYHDNHKFEYEVYPNGYERINKVDNLHIAGDKHPYECKFCGAIYQSKNIDCRNIFPTDDPRCLSECHNKEGHDLTRICKCEPVIKY